MEKFAGILFRKGKKYFGTVWFLDKAVNIGVVVAVRSSRRNERALATSRAGNKTTIFIGSGEVGATQGKGVKVAGTRLSNTRMGSCVS